MKHLVVQFYIMHIEPLRVLHLIDRQHIKKIQLYQSMLN